ncbi:hypothetical protein VNI00_002339 [Paramarasmius palmivorus]|uniref:Ubiquitin-like domain-containing protein n=1 Tax=Paramarasmius palmivorus TaxID=297713 RepID=A0AAW0DYI1_9AGAR
MVEFESRVSWTATTTIARVKGDNNAQSFFEFHFQVDEQLDEVLIVQKSHPKAISTYSAALLEAKACFPQLAARPITLQTDQLEVSDGKMVDITPGAWSLVLDEVSTFHVFASSDSQPNTTPSPASNSRTVQTIRLTVMHGVYPSIDVYVKPTTQFRHLIRAVAAKFGFLCAEDLRLTYDGVRLADYDTPACYGMENGDTLLAMKDQRGGKPVIYLFSPNKRESRVELSLVPEWEFSAIYPVVPIKKSSKGQHIHGSVRTTPDGHLEDLATGLDVAYLFWEAHPSDSVLLHIAEVPKYLDRSLIALGLHTEARTSFITYWLPSLLKHTHVALRYLPQAAYERAAPLSVTPTPDVVTRIFMLFKGIDISEEVRGDWTESEQRALEDVSLWRVIVGVDVERALDSTLFRVLEWGGMEVLD